MPTTRHAVERKHNKTHNKTHKRRALVLELQQPDSGSIWQGKAAVGCGTGCTELRVPALHRGALPADDTRGLRHESRTHTSSLLSGQQQRVGAASAPPVPPNRLLRLRCRRSHRPHGRRPPHALPASTPCGAPLCGGLRGCLILRLALLGGINSGCTPGSRIRDNCSFILGTPRAPSVASARNDRHLRRRLGWPHVQELLTAEVRLGSVWKVYNTFYGSRLVHVQTGAVKGPMVNFRAPQRSESAGMVSHHSPLASRS